MELIRTIAFRRSISTEVVRILLLDTQRPGDSDLTNC
jgi:hypothetical protein